MRLQRRALARNAQWLAVIVAIAALAVVCGAYILSQERLQSPFASSYGLNAAFSSVDAVTPGLGEPVNVAGVRVGQISGVTLANGHGVISMRIDPSLLPRLYGNARAALVPNTPLKDMQVDLVPGDASAGVLAHGATIGLAQTTTPVDSDELLAALDSDTRTWLGSLLVSLGTGLHNRGPDVRRMLRTLGPTDAQLKTIGDLLATRRRELPTLVGDLAVLTRSAGDQAGAVSTAVAAGDATLGALAREDGALGQAVGQLPATLRQAAGTLGDTTTLARALGPALEALTPTARNLRATLSDTRTLFTGAALLPLREVRRFVDTIGPLSAAVGPAVRNLGAATPPLESAFGVVNRLVNELAYDPGGANQGFLFWLAWFAHNADSVFSTQDANGSVARGLAVVSCSSLAQPGTGPILQMLIGATSTPTCPAGG